MGPLISKQWWTHLGKLLRRGDISWPLSGCLRLRKAQEEYPHRLPDDAWISLRLDGCCWGTLMARLKATKILDLGFREEVAETMVASCRAVMCEFGGVVGYTHSCLAWGVDTP